MIITHVAALLEVVVSLNTFQHPPEENNKKKKNKDKRRNVKNERELKGLQPGLG